VLFTGLKLDGIASHTGSATPLAPSLEVKNILSSLEAAKSIITMDSTSPRVSASYKTSAEVRRKEIEIDIDIRRVTESTALTDLSTADLKYVLKLYEKKLKVFGACTYAELEKAREDLLKATTIEKARKCLSIVRGVEKRLSTDVTTTQAEIIEVHKAFAARLKTEAGEACDSFCSKHFKFVEERFNKLQDVIERIENPVLRRAGKCALAGLVAVTAMPLALGLTMGVGVTLLGTAQLIVTGSTQVLSAFTENLILKCSGAITIITAAVSARPILSGILKLSAVKQEERVSDLSDSIENLKRELAEYTSVTAQDLKRSLVSIVRDSFDNLVQGKCLEFYGHRDNIRQEILAELSQISDKVDEEYSLTLLCKLKVLREIEAAVGKPAIIELKTLLGTYLPDTRLSEDGSANFKNVLDILHCPAARRYLGLETRELLYFPNVDYRFQDGYAWREDNGIKLRRCKLSQEYAYVISSPETLARSFVATLFDENFKERVNLELLQIQISLVMKDPELSKACGGLEKLQELKALSENYDEQNHRVIVEGVIDIFERLVNANANSIGVSDSLYLLYHSEYRTDAYASFKREFKDQHYEPEFRRGFEFSVDPYLNWAKNQSSPEYLLTQYAKVIFLRPEIPAEERKKWLDKQHCIGQELTNRVVSTLAVRPNEEQREKIHETLNFLLRVFVGSTSGYVDTKRYLAEKIIKNIEYYAYGPKETLADTVEDVLKLAGLIETVQKSSYRSVLSFEEGERLFAVLPLLETDIPALRNSFAPNSSGTRWSFVEQSKEVIEPYKSWARQFATPDELMFELIQIIRQGPQDEIAQAELRSPQHVWLEELTTAVVATLQEPPTQAQRQLIHETLHTALGIPNRRDSSCGIDVGDKVFARGVISKLGYYSSLGDCLKIELASCYAALEKVVAGIENLGRGEFSNLVTSQRSTAVATLAMATPELVQPEAPVLYNYVVIGGLAERLPTSPVESDYEKVRMVCRLIPPTHDVVKDKSKLEELVSSLAEISNYDILLAIAQQNESLTASEAEIVLDVLRMNAAAPALGISACVKSMLAEKECSPQELQSVAIESLTTHIKTLLQGAVQAESLTAKELINICTVYPVYESGLAKQFSRKQAIPIARLAAVAEFEGKSYEFHANDADYLSSLQERLVNLFPNEEQRQIANEYLAFRNNDRSFEELVPEHSVKSWLLPNSKTFSQLDDATIEDRLVALSGSFTTLFDKGHLTDEFITYISQPKGLNPMALRAEYIAAERSKMQRINPKKAKTPLTEESKIFYDQLEARISKLSLDEQLAEIDNAQRQVRVSQQRHRELYRSNALANSLEDIKTKAMPEVNHIISQIEFHRKILGEHAEVIESLGFSFFDSFNEKVYLDSLVGLRTALTESKGTDHAMAKKIESTLDTLEDLFGLAEATLISLSQKLRKTREHLNSHNEATRRAITVVLSAEESVLMEEIQNKLPDMSDYIFSVCKDKKLNKQAVIGELEKLSQESAISDLDTMLKYCSEQERTLGVLVSRSVHGLAEQSLAMVNQCLDYRPKLNSVGNAKYNIANVEPLRQVIVAYDEFGIARVNGTIMLMKASELGQNGAKIFTAVVMDRPYTSDKSPMSFGKFNALVEFAYEEARRLKLPLIIPKFAMGESGYRALLIERLSKREFVPRDATVDLAIKVGASKAFYMELTDFDVYGENDISENLTGLLIV